MKKTVLMSFLSLVLLSCEKSVDFDLNDAEPVLSVDASIETNEAPVVILTRSLNYFSTVTADVIGQSVIRDAQVFIRSGSTVYPLRRFDVVLGGNVPFSFYSSDPSRPQEFLRGEEGKQYTLQINWAGRQYQASTSIPVLRKKVDSLWWEKVPGAPDTSTRAVLLGRVTDPPGFGDYIRYFTRVNSGAFFPGINSVFDDLLVNGTTYDIPIDKGVDRNSEIDFDNFVFFRKGDTVTLKFCNIDKATYDFWRTTEFSYQSIGNPFSTPTKILGNISNGALGYFGGYATQFRTIIIPR
jgi:hypothetical protein